MIKQPLVALIILTGLHGIQAIAAMAQSPFEHTGQSELFVDTERIADLDGVWQVTHPAQKRNEPVLEPELPWERDRVYIYGNVHRDPDSGLFRMWYNTTGLCYAESEDGIHWRKPSLGLHEYEGSKENNIVLPGVGNTTVFVDENAEDPEQKYKMLSGNRDNYEGAYSADGIHWTMYNDGGKLIPYGSELVTVNRDPETGEYLAFIRTRPPQLAPDRIKTVRTCALTTSRDFLNWTEPVETIVADEFDKQWILNDKEQAGEFYGWSGFRSGSQYLGFLTVFRVTGLIRAPRPSSQSAWDGPIDVQLISSRDGRTWHRTKDRSPVVPNGPHDYDAGTILDIANNPIVVGDELWLYYTAINTTHGGTRPPKRITIALATWPLDRLASLRAGWAEGIVTTKPMTAESGPLWVNADAEGGRMVVEVLDADGQPIPGFTAEDCTVIDTDSLEHRVTWSGGDVIDLDDPFALRFRFQHADLFAYRIGESR